MMESASQANPFSAVRGERQAVMKMINGEENTSATTGLALLSHSRQGQK
jgi:hypothetical protein